MRTTMNPKPVPVIDHVPDTNAALKAQAVRIAGGCCWVCGGPCGPLDARRRIEPDHPHLDVVGNWSATCATCQDRLPKLGKLPPPARYVAHIHDGPRFKRWLRRTWHGAIALFATVYYLSLWGIAGWTGWEAVSNDKPLLAVGAATLLLVLCWVALRVIGEPTRHWTLPTQRVHHSHDVQTVRVEQHLQ